MWGSPADAPWFSPSVLKETCRPCRCISNIIEPLFVGCDPFQFIFLELNFVFVSSCSHFDGLIPKFLGSSSGCSFSRWNFLGSLDPGIPKWLKNPFLSHPTEVNQALLKFCRSQFLGPKGRTRTIPTDGFLRMCWDLINIHLLMGNHDIYIYIHKMVLNRKNRFIPTFSWLIMVHHGSSPKTCTMISIDLPDFISARAPPDSWQFVDRSPFLPASSTSPQPENSGAMASTWGCPERQA